MNEMTSSKYGHLKLLHVDNDYKYVLFPSQESFMTATSDLVSTPTNLPFGLFVTADEYSAIIPSSFAFTARIEKEVPGWVCFRIVGEMPFGSVQGLIATISNQLNAVNIGICVVSTYKTDLFFIRQKYLPAAAEVLTSHGWNVDHS